MITAWAASGAISFNARPISSEGLDSGRDQHPFVRAGLELEQQVGADGGRAEQRGHHQDRRDEPLPDALADRALGLPAERADQQRSEEAEEHQRLDHPEDHRERIPQHGPQFPGHHQVGVADELSRAPDRSCSGRPGRGDRPRRHAIAFPGHLEGSVTRGRAPT